MSCFFTPKVRVYYHPRSSLAGLSEQMIRYARGRMRLLRKHPETFSVACLIPILFLLGLFAGPLLALFSPVLATFYQASLALYGALVIAVSGHLALARRDARLVLFLPFVFPTIHLATGAGGVLELLRWLTRGEPEFSTKSMPRPAVAPLARAADADGTALTVAMDEH